MDGISAVMGVEIGDNVPHHILWLAGEGVLKRFRNTGVIILLASERLLG